jgi:chemosensory pili system protein ChpE
VWCFVCAAIVDRLFRHAGQRWASITYRLCAVAFLALALGSLRDLLQPCASAANSSGCIKHAIAHTPER